MYYHKIIARGWGWGGWGHWANGWARGWGHVASWGHAWRSAPSFRFGHCGIVAMHGGGGVGLLVALGIIILLALLCTRSTGK